MLTLQNISKQYGKQPVFQNVTVQIPKTGFFLLLGESGSGKTTFLNILAGQLSFEEGIAVCETEYCENKIPLSFTEQTEYMTQDAFFADFLSIKDNLKLFGSGEDETDELLGSVGLNERGKALPPTLSGGERQRLMLARALLRGKQVLLLDEPTASLDQSNKEQIFTLLRKLSEDHLVIMASHDPKAMEFADSVLRFDKASHKAELEQMKPSPKTEDPIGEVPVDREQKSNGRRQNAGHYLKQWMRSSGREKRSRILFVLFMTLAIFLIILADTPGHKNEATMRSLYRLNCLKLTVQGRYELEELLPKDETVKAKVIDYGSSVPTGTEQSETGMHMTLDYELSFNELPDERSLCSVSDLVRAGSYFTGPNQIILSDEMADALSPAQPEKLIGKKLRKKLFGLGETELEIVGIFDVLSDKERIYLNNCGAQLFFGSYLHPGDERQTFFVSASTFEPLIDDPEFYSESGGRQRVWYLYFDSYESMHRFYQAQKEAMNRDLDNEGGRVLLELQGIPLEYQLDWPLISWTILPFSALMLLITLLFFANLKRTELAYNNRFIAVFEYAGYSKKQIIGTLVRLSFGEFLAELGIAASIAFSMACIGNLINQKYDLIPMRLFSFNPWILSGSLLLLIVFAFLILYTSLSRVKTTGWYELLRETRDLL